MGPPLPKPLGRNRGGYAGDSINVSVVLKRSIDAALRLGWTVDCTGENTPIALRREIAHPTRRIYVSAGIHGDEPAGPLAALRLLEDDLWPADTSLWLCPCLNPSGMARGVRENPDRIDLNRDYRDAKTVEVRAHKRWLEAQPRFDLTLCLHEDWEAQGFYLYELRRESDPAHSERIIEAVSTLCPIDHSPIIDGREARDGIISPSIDIEARALWPEAVHLFATKCDHCLTLEAPSDFALEVRVRALVTAVKAALVAT